MTRGGSWSEGIRKRGAVCRTANWEVALGMTLLSFNIPRPGVDILPLWLLSFELDVLRFLIFTRKNFIFCGYSLCTVLV